ncbi:hypothetical protein CYL31_11945 [Marinomonas sp. A3A]|uniref:hypothetical protein n=1 Tax=Marinomonas sp. A3A TaxID=2065312 RepID=UPI001BB3E4DC|nr:hypothetical protein [Marinomonas sp. A3A]QUX92079.1 hypothetical protein CYL31_11945 [Marinomonas sp. A3A]
MEPSTIGQVVKVAGKSYNIMVEAYQSRHRKRVDNFFRFVDLSYGHLKTSDVDELTRYVSSEEGQDVLASFADTITQTSCERAQMALAILYCKDRDFSFDKNETYTFTTAMIGMNDDLLNFFLEVCKLNRESDQYVYPRSGVNSSNADIFMNKGWSEEAIFVYLNDLIRLRLILPDPLSHSSSMSNGSGWGVWFGLTDRSLKINALILKATHLLEYHSSDQVR